MHAVDTPQVYKNKVHLLNVSLYDHNNFLGSQIDHRKYQTNGECGCLQHQQTNERK